MTSFNAAEVVQPLDYDFTAFGGSKGVIPEPSTDQLDAFFNEIRKIAKEVQSLRAKAEAVQNKEASEMTNEEVDQILAEMDDLSIGSFQNKMAEAVARLCSGQPSEQEVLALPHRVKQAFIQWITGEFRGEAGTPTTRG